MTPEEKQKAEEIVNDFDLIIQDLYNYFGHSSYIQRCRLHDLKEKTTQWLLSNKQWNPEEPYEPYFGWCDVADCKNEGSSGGLAWRDSGYWTVCSAHSQIYREGGKQPKMKRLSVKREKSRLTDGTLPNPPQI